MEEVIRDDAGSISYHLNIHPEKLQPYIDNMADGIALLPKPINLSIVERYGMIEVSFWLHSIVDGEKRSMYFLDHKCYKVGRLDSGVAIDGYDSLRILYYTVREILNELNSMIKHGKMVVNTSPCVVELYDLNKEQMWITCDYK